jgi:hypothetical protein
LKCPRATEAFFKPSNYLFSTKAESRKETLYFRDRRTGRTGRLRQQHQKGPLAKVDKKPKMHRFVSPHRFKCLKRWHEKHKGRVPRFYAYEKRLQKGKHHIEFVWDAKKLSGWHSSGGTIETGKLKIRRRIREALAQILGCSGHPLEPLVTEKLL